MINYRARRRLISILTKDFRIYRVVVSSLELLCRHLELPKQLTVACSRGEEAAAKFFAFSFLYQWRDTDYRLRPPLSPPPMRTVAAEEKSPIAAVSVSGGYIRALAPYGNPPRLKQLCFWRLQLLHWPSAFETLGWFLLHS